MTTISATKPPSLRFAPMHNTPVQEPTSDSPFMQKLMHASEHLFEVVSKMEPNWNSGKPDFTAALKDARSAAANLSSSLKLEASPEAKGWAVEARETVLAGIEALKSLQTPNTE